MLLEALSLLSDIGQRIRGVQVLPVPPAGHRCGCATGENAASILEYDVSFNCLLQCTLAVLCTA